MIFARRTALLRLTAMTALLASAVLTSDHLNPGRAFCPLAEACAAASKSELGSFYGIPTSVLGMIAFGGLFLITLLPVEWARPLLRPAGFFAAMAGVGFVAYQFFFLHAWCPLCLVADGAGFLAGVITLSWPTPPIMRMGGRIPGEAASSMLAWTFAAMLITVGPFAWPRSEEPAWVEITPVDETAFEDELEEDAPEVPEPVIAVAPTPEPERPKVDGITILANAPTASNEGLAPAEDIAAIEAPARPETPTEPAPATEPEVDAAPAQPEPAPTPTPAPAPKPKRVRPQGPLLVEYLNAFCPHCRKTLHRLEDVLAEHDGPVRKRRVYTWASKDYPLWARACAYAQTVGAEERMFQELLKARSQSRSEVFAAARRAGLDMQALKTAVHQAQPPARLLRDQRIVQRARIRMLPTIDIGRRRLQGEQSTSELRDALRIAAEAYARKAQP